MGKSLVSLERLHASLLSRAGLGPLLAALAALALYAHSVRFGFVFDDVSLIGPGGPRFLGTSWLPYRPLRYLSLWADQLAGGGQPWAYHADNIILHALVAALVVVLARRFGARALAACLAGLLFALHPLAVEAVAYVSGRRDLLATLAGLAALAAWSARPSRSGPALIFLLLSVAAKESGLLFAPVLLLASLCRVGPELTRSWKPLAGCTIAGLFLAVAYGAVGPLLPEAPLDRSLALAGQLASHYMGSLLAPLHLSVAYPRLAATSGWGRAAWAGLVLLAGLGVGAGTALYRAAGRPGAHGSTLALGWFALVLASLALVIGRHEPGADRHAYPLLAAASVLLAASSSELPARLGAGERITTHFRIPSSRHLRPLLNRELLDVAQTTPADSLNRHDRIWRKSRRELRGAVLSRALSAAAGAVAMVALLAFARLSWVQSEVWRSQWTLWSHAVVSSPDSARAQHNLAALLASAGAYGHARRHLQRALAAEPGYAPAYLGLARIDCASGHRRRARERLAQARSAGAAATEIAAIERSCAAGGRGGR